MKYNLAIEVQADVADDEKAQAICQRLFPGMELYFTRRIDQRFCDMGFVASPNYASDDVAVMSTLRYFAHVTQYWNLDLTLDRPRMLKGETPDADGTGSIYCQFTLSK